MSEIIDYRPGVTDAVIDGDVVPVAPTDERLEGIAPNAAIIEDVFSDEAKAAAEFDAAEERYRIALSRYEDQVADERDKHPLGIGWNDAAAILAGRGITEPKPPLAELEDTEEDIDKARLNKAAAETLRRAELAAKIEQLKAEILDPVELEKAIVAATAKHQAKYELRHRDA
ncbi:MAG TPA: hypothetical protein QF549_02935 [Candidatus Saccharimonadaceae bacterium]|nr:hypothetical protein [Candidatus Saccharimonadaceae bacterium]